MKLIAPPLSASRFKQAHSTFLFKLTDSVKTIEHKGSLCKLLYYCISIAIKSYVKAPAGKAGRKPPPVALAAFAAPRVRWRTSYDNEITVLCVHAPYTVIV